MNIRYLVQQYDERGFLIHEKEYRFRIWAAIVAWVVAGRGIFPGEFYSTRVVKVYR